MNDTRTTTKRTRRGCMQTLASRTRVIGLNPISGSWITAAQAAIAAEFEKLPPLDRTLLAQPAIR